MKKPPCGGFIGLQNLYRRFESGQGLYFFKEAMNPPKLEIYTTQTCPYCTGAKQLLTQRGIEYIEHPVDNNPAARAAMAELVGGKTSVPQIFIQGKSIGGYTELRALDSQGKLMGLLEEA